MILLDIASVNNCYQSYENELIIVTIVMITKDDINYKNDRIQIFTIFSFRVHPLCSHRISLKDKKCLLSANVISNAVMTSK